MPRMQAIAEPTSLTTLPLWERTRAMFARAVAAIGAPAAIAAIALITRALRRDIVGWLCPLESIARKLLLAEAAELKRTELARAEHGPRLVQIPLAGMAQNWSPESFTSFIPSLPLASMLIPVSGLGEALFTLWLLIMGVNAEKWRAQAESS